MKFKTAIIFFFFSIVLLAQNKPLKLKPLKEVLVVLETNYSLVFSYADEVVNSKIIDFDFSKYNLAQLIPILEDKTHLDFKEVTKNHYTITLPPKLKNISGFVYDALTKQPLPEATIWTRNFTSTTTNNGFFEVKNALRTDSLKVSYIGYKTSSMQINNFRKNTCDTIFLEEVTNRLKEVLITNYLTNGIYKQVDGAVVFIPKNHTVLPGLTEPDILLSVQQLPGILNVDETASGLHIRGGTPDQNLVLFNNIKLFNTSHFFGAISGLNPYVIDKVKVYRSASNVKYGNHISGVVDMETENEVPEKVSGGFGLNFLHIDGVLKAPISSKVGIIISARRSYTDVLETPTFERLSDKNFQNTVISEDLKVVESTNFKTDTKFHYLDFSTKVIFDINSKNKLSFNQIALKNKLNYQFVDNEHVENRSDDLEIDNTGYSINWDKIINENTTQQVNVSYSKFDLQYRNSKFNNSEKYAFNKKDNNLTNIDVRASLHHKINTNSIINFGYQYAYNSVSFNLNKYNSHIYYSSKVFEDNINNSHTVFGEYSYKKNNNITLNVGVRANYFSLLNKVTVEPRIFGQVKLKRNLWLNSSIEKKQQNISKILEFYTSDFGLENQLWALSNNSTIPLLTSEQFTIGILYKYNNWLFDLDVYRRNIDGLTSLTSGFESYVKTIYVGDSKTLGLDLLVKKNWKNYNTWVSYTTGNTDFIFENFNDNKKFKGNFDVSHSFYWAHNYNINKFDFSLGWNYRIGIPYTYIQEFNPNYEIVSDAINNKRLPNYQRLDFSSTYNFMLDKKQKLKAKLGLSILNVLGQKSILKRDYDVIFNKEGSGVLIEKNINSLGVTPNLIFRVEF